MIAIRENGAFIIPRSIQHTSQVVYKDLNYLGFDFHSLRHTHRYRAEGKRGAAKLLAEDEILSASDR